MSGARRRSPSPIVASVDAPDRHEPGERAGDEGLVGAVDVGQREALLEGRDAGLARDLQNVPARDAAEAVFRRRGPQLAAAAR